MNQERKCAAVQIDERKLFPKEYFQVASMSHSNGLGQQTSDLPLHSQSKW